MARVILIEAYPVNPATGLAVPQRWCSGVGLSTTSGESNTPDSGGGPNVTYEPRVDGKPKVSVSLDEEGIVVAQGTVTILITDRQLDALADYRFEGQRIYLRLTDDTVRVGGSVWGRPLVFVGYLQDPEFTGDRLILRFRSAGDRLRKAQLLTSTYGGTGGLDGIADLAGRLQPFLIGSVRNVSPVLIDPSRLIYQMSGPLPAPYTAYANYAGASSVGAVWDDGVSITQGAAYPDEATMLSTAPAAGTFRVLPYESSGSKGLFFRLGSSPAGTVTCNAGLDPTNDATSIIQVIVWVAAMAYTSNIHLLSGVAIGAVTGFVPAGLYFTEQTTVLAALARLLKSFNGWLTPVFPSSGDNVDYLSIQYLRDPNATSGAGNDYYYQVPANLTVIGGPGGEILAFDRVATLPPNIPTRRVWRVRLQYERNYTIQSRVAAGATNEVKAYAPQPFLNATVSDATVLAADSEAIELAPETEWVRGNMTAITGEATRVLDLHKVLRHGYRLVARVTERYLGDWADRYPPGWAIVTAAQQRIGWYLTVAGDSRFGCNPSRKFLVLGFDIDYVTDEVTFLLWG